MRGEGEGLIVPNRRKTPNPVAGVVQECGPTARKLSNVEQLKNSKSGEAGHPAVLWQTVRAITLIAGEGHKLFQANGGSRSPAAGVRQNRPQKKEVQ